MSGPRYVIAGPPGSGKSTWVQQTAQPGDLVWDLDEVAGVVGYKGKLPTHLKGRLPHQVMKATLVMRDALVQWLSTTELACGVYVIVTDPVDAALVGRQIGASLRILAAR